MSDRKLPQAGLKVFRKIKVLVVDDDDGVRSMLKLLLSMPEQIEEVREAFNGKEAVEICRNYHPDLIVLDVVMPEMDGTAAAAEIRTMYPDARILAFSATTETKPEWADCYLQKTTMPDPDELVRLVLDG